MKKILIATDTFLPKIDGVSIFLTKVIPELSKYYDITLVCPKFPGNIKDYDYIKIIRTKISRIKIANYNIPLPKNKQIKDLVKNSDLIWIQSIGPIGYNVLKNAKKLNKKVIAYVHAIEGKRFSMCSETTSRLKLFLNYLTKIYERSFYNKCDKLMLSSNMISKILYKAGINRKEVMIPLGVESNKFKPLNKEKAKKNVGLEDKFIIGYLGRISNEKNLETLRDAFVNLPIENKLLLIIGDGSKSQKKIFNNVNNVKITGFIDNVIPYLQAMDVYVLPSLTETSSLSTLEAMSTGLPVVATPVGAISDYIYNGKNGILFNIKDIDSLTKILLSLYNNKKLRETLGKNARKTASEFSWEETVKKIREAFDEEF